jgi:hypothetical protein
VQRSGSPRDVPALVALAVELASDLRELCSGPARHEVKVRESGHRALELCWSARELDRSSHASGAREASSEGPEERPICVAVCQGAICGSSD